MQEKGSISIHSENIFPIIKKFLYSDNEIFLRELVSNAVDATQKIKHLVSIGESKTELGDLKVKVEIHKEDKKIIIKDAGLGMTADEIKKYINQIAFSGATEFVEKYKDKDATDTQNIIGHFGLGFYSAYMVADQVEIITKSHKDEPAARWICDGSTEFEITDADRTERGTDIVLHISEEGEEFLEPARLKGVLDKYCKFLPVEIEFEENVVNNPAPIWTKAPSELADEDYIKFYKELYPMAEDPLFWIHLNVDYPFNLTGVLYFPKVKKDFEIAKSKIHLYSRQVFITDEVKDVVPEFLMLLHGVIDSPDIPLNVSRSFLQADGNVRKINSHITKKVSDKLNEIYKKDRKAYEEKWEDISVFVKYGMLSEEKFYDRASKICLYKNTAGEHYTMEEYLEKITANQTDKDGKKVILYASDLETQTSFVNSAKNKNYDVLVFDHIIDSHLVGNLEQKLENVSIKRIDSESVEKLIDKGEELASVLSESENTKVKEVFDKVINDTHKTVVIEALDSEETPVSIVLPEFMRRMKDMQMAGGQQMMCGEMQDAYHVIVNANHSLTQKIINGDDEKAASLTKQAYDLAQLSQGLLKGEALSSFINRSVELID